MCMTDDHTKETRMAISYTKLKSGNWGIRSDKILKEGEVVSVTTKAGKTNTETVKKVIWTDGKAWLAAIEEKRQPAQRGGNKPYECEECGDRVTPGTQCWETGMLH